MSYITLFIAWLQMQSMNLSGGAWSLAFWNKVLVMNTTIFKLSWFIWGIAIIWAILYGLVAIRRGLSLSELFSCVGCVGIILLLLPLGAWINMKEAEGIVHSLGPTGEIANTMNFYISLALFLFFGVF